MAENSHTEYDRGFTLLEVLMVVVVLGIIAAVVTAGAGGIRSTANENACDSDQRTLETAAAVYLARPNISTITPADATDNGPEQTLVAENLLKSVSELHDLDASGTVLVASNSTC